MTAANATMHPKSIQKREQILRYLVVSMTSSDLLLLISVFNKMMLMIKVNNPLTVKVIQRGEVSVIADIEILKITPCTFWIRFRKHSEERAEIPPILIAQHSHATFIAIVLVCLVCLKTEETMNMDNDII